MIATQNTIRLLIVEDSDVIAYLLRAIFEKTNDIEVVAHARNGAEAIGLVAKYKPDIITMDIRMPHMNGFEATRQIMASMPTPIVVISSSVDSIELDIAFNALSAGALTVIEKPENVMAEGFKDKESELLDTIRAFSGMHVIKRRNIKPINLSHSKSRVVNKLAALGVSTGGPEVLSYILPSLPIDYALPVVVVQHMSESFLPGLIDWLNLKSVLQIKLAEDGEVLTKGKVYFAPDSYHLHIINVNDEPVARLVDKPLVDSFKPSVTELFSSIAKAFPGAAIAGLLTGMGRDGASGLLEMYEAKCHTFVQDKSSCVVFGMPAVALELQASKNIVKLDNIPNYLITNS